MWTLVWFALIFTPQGVVPLQSKDGPFKTEAECVEFGRQHLERGKDWFRGKIDAPFDMTIEVVVECVQEGRPA